jgi:hypothetical protein
LELKNTETNVREKIPKFGGLELEENERPFHKSNVQNEV